jgi:Zn-dependent M28 family amino/carboxypeptidase
MDTYLQPFNYTYEETRNISVRGPSGESVFVLSVQYNTPTPLPGGITAALVDTPVDNERGSGCFADQWQGIDATGKLALVKRGICAISDKLKLARAHGALGVILYNQNPGTTYGSATLGADNINLVVPVGIIPLEVGTAWKARIAAGETVQANLLVDAIFDHRDTWNVISETKEGNPNSIIMMGAHLDSVKAGPGINDDGSGTTALLEVMGSMKKYGGFPNKVRFAWWAAEEAGLVGSLHYTSSLSAAEADKIKYYFNYDMIGSPVPDYGVFLNNNSGIGAEILKTYINSHGKPAEYM